MATAKQSRNNNKSKKRKRRKKAKVLFARLIFGILLLALAALLIFAGRKVFMLIRSGQEEAPMTTRVSVQKDGSVNEILVEPFDETIYSKEDLEKTVKDSVSAYGGDMSFEKTETENGVVRLYFTFKNPETFSSFHGVVFNAGTADKLRSKGVVIPDEALQNGGKQVVLLSDLMDFTDPKISDKIEIVLPQKLRYSSGPVTKDPDNTKKAIVDSASGGTAILVY